MSHVAKAFDFTGRRVLITGGAKGIGREAVKQFTELGATVFALDIDAEALNQLKSEFPGVTPIQVDVSNWGAVEKAIKPLYPIHHLVNNAGVFGKPKSLFELVESDMARMYNLNVNSLIGMTQIVARGMIDHKVEGATIVNLASVASSINTPGYHMYGSSKAAVVYLTKSIARELAPHNIRVNCVRPAIVRTDMMKEVDPAFLDVLRSRMILGSDFLTTDEVVNAVLFLSSSLSSKTTGSAVTVDAGRETIQ